MILSMQPVGHVYPCAFSILVDAVSGGGSGDNRVQGKERHSSEKVCKPNTYTPGERGHPCIIVIVRHLQSRFSMVGPKGKVFAPVQRKSSTKPRQQKDDQSYDTTLYHFICRDNGYHGEGSFSRSFTQASGYRPEHW